jgi:hypothetical protein
MPTTIDKLIINSPYEEPKQQHIAQHIPLSERGNEGVCIRDMDTPRPDSVGSPLSRGESLNQGESFG